MEAIFKAKDNTFFTNSMDCFNYEWREFYPNIYIYDEEGNRMSAIDENVQYIFYDNANEKDFVCKFLDTICDHACPLDKSCGVAIVNTIACAYVLTTLEEFKDFSLPSLNPFCELSTTFS